MSVNPPDVLSMRRMVQEQAALAKLQQAGLQNPMNQQQPEPPALPLDPMQPDQQQQPQQQQPIHPDFTQTIQMMNTFMQAAIQRQDLNFDIQTKGILTMAQAVQQLYSSGHVDAISQQHQMTLNEQGQAHTQSLASGQAHLQASQQAHQQALDAARLNMESASHAQQMQHADEMHKAKLLQLGHSVASAHEKQNVDTALKVQQAQHQEQQHQQNISNTDAMHQVQVQQAAKPQTSDSSKK